MNGRLQVVTQPTTRRVIAAFNVTGPQTTQDLALFLDGRFDNADATVWASAADFDLDRMEKNATAEPSNASRFRPLPVDPDGMNAARSAWAGAALAQLRKDTRADACDAVLDLLADLMHYCDRNGFAFNDELRKARSQYREETESLEQH